MNRAAALVSSCLMLLAALSTLATAKKELKFLHVLSANKFYVPDYDYKSAELQVPGNLTYKYFVENALDVPNSVKLHLYNLGAYLRNMYGDFLGSLYLEDIILMQTTEHPVSIIAGELINAGLWPPVEPQIWKDDLAWQPIPFAYTPATEDVLLLGSLCSTFEHETRKVLNNHFNLSAEQSNLMDHIRTKGQVNVKNPFEVALLYLVLQNSIELNQRHPAWVKEIFPGDQLFNLTLTAYQLLSKTTIQKQLNGGPLIKQIINDFKDIINGSLSVNRKINVYSGDERSLAGVLAVLNISMSSLPDPGAALVFELYEENKNHFVKINHYKGLAKETPYQLEGCEMFCPIETFNELVIEYLPENELSLCGSMIDKPETDGAPTLSAMNTVFSLLIVYIGTKL